MRDARTLLSGFVAVALGVAGGLAVSAPALADQVVYNGGSPDQGGTIYAESTDGFAVGMNFTLPTGVTSISDANWWGGCYPSTNCGTSPSFTLGIYTDTGGSGPGTEIASVSVGGANQTATGNLIGGSYTEYAYSASFAPISLMAGTEYWFSITGTTGGGTFGVETTSSAPSGSQLYTYGIFGDYWSSAPETLAFELTSGVPEPSTWAMMGLGFAGLGFVSYRARKVAVLVAA